MTKHVYMLCLAQKLIDDIQSDKTVLTTQVIKSLRSLSDHIEAHIEAMEYDLNRKEES